MAAVPAPTRAGSRDPGHWAHPEKCQGCKECRGVQSVSIDGDAKPWKLCILALGAAHHFVSCLSCQPSPRAVAAANSRLLCCHLGPRGPLRWPPPRSANPDVLPSGVSLYMLVCIILEVTWHPPTASPLILTAFCMCGASYFWTEGTVACFAWPAWLVVILWGFELCSCWAASMLF